MSRKLTDSREECERQVDLYNQVKERAAQMETDLRGATQNEQEVHKLLSSCLYVKKITYPKCFCAKLSLFVKPEIHMVDSKMSAFCQKKTWLTFWCSHVET